MNPIVKFKRLPEGEGLPLPSYANPGDSGMDLYAAAVDGDDVEILRGERIKVLCGFAIEIPDGFEGQIRPRSGLAVNGVTVLNAPGTLDQGFRGPVAVILINHGRAPFVLNRGDRIAQLVICPVARAEIVEVSELTETERGEGGFGSTGT